MISAMNEFKMGKNWFSWIRIVLKNRSTTYAEYTSRTAVVFLCQEFPCSQIVLQIKYTYWYCCNKFSTWSDYLSQVLILVWSFVRSYHTNKKMAGNFVSLIQIRCCISMLLSILCILWLRFTSFTPSDIVRSSLITVRGILSSRIPNATWCIQSNFTTSNRVLYECIHQLLDESQNVSWDSRIHVHSMFH